tara:strand:- start:2361 stop:2513 length:153 start_codon:yes stop_codon:yes gene_type:complete
MTDNSRNKFSQKYINESITLLRNITKEKEFSNWEEKKRKKATSKHAFRCV